MKVALFFIALMLPISASAASPDKFAETCVGTEMILAENVPPKTVPYSITFSVDLASGYYCYAECKPQQTYKISDPASNPIKLADVRGGPWIRLMTFDRKSETLTDHQVTNVLTRVEGLSKATCRAATFQQPSP